MEDTKKIAHQIDIEVGRPQSKRSCFSHFDISGSLQRWREIEALPDVRQTSRIPNSHLLWMVIFQFTVSQRPIRSKMVCSFSAQTHSLEHLLALADLQTGIL